MFDTVLRLDREACLGVSDSHRVHAIGGCRDGYKPDDGCIYRIRLVDLEGSKISDSVDTPLYANTVNRGQRSSKALLSVAADCCIKRIYTRDISKISKPFSTDSMSLTRVPNLTKKLGAGFEP